jgi:hypothetical protein
MSRLLLSAEWPQLDEIVDWCHANHIDLYYGRIWADLDSAIGWQAVLENTPKITFLLIKYADSVSVLEF